MELASKVLQQPSLQQCGQYDNSYIINGKAYDPFTIRVKWKQYFPPRQEWVTNSRHQRPETSPGNIQTTKPLSRLNRSRTFYHEDKDDLVTERSRTFYHKLKVDGLQTDDYNEVTDLEAQHESGKVKRKRKRRKTHKTKQKGDKVKHCEKEAGTNLLIRSHTLPQIKSAQPEIDDHDNVKKRKTRKSGIKRHKHGRKKSSKKDYQLSKLGAKSKSFIANDRNSAISKPEVPWKNTWNKLPRLPIPSNWKWKSSTTEPSTTNTTPWTDRQKGVTTAQPTTWKWYENPNQFKKGHPASSFSSSSSLKSMQQYTLRSRTIL